MHRLALLCALSLPLTAAELIFTDDFTRTDLGEWKVVIPTFSVQDGVLKGEQTRDDHGAVGRIHRPMRDVRVEFKFKLAGSTTFNAVFDDQKHKESHAGHICRVAFTPKLIRLGDDKEGVMRNDIFALRKDPARKAEADKLLAGRSASAPAQLEQDRWYQVAITILGEEMTVRLDGQAAGHLKSPGLAHPTKTSFHFTVNGPGALFDDIRITPATP